MTIDPHRKLCTKTSGILSAYLDMSDEDTNMHDDIDRHTVEKIVEAYNEIHDETRGVKTPKPD